MTDTTDLADAREVILELDKIIGHLRRENAALVRALRDLLSDADDLEKATSWDEHREASRAALRRAAEEDDPA